MKVYHKGYSKSETLENNTRNSTHGVGFYVFKDLQACKEHKSTNNKIYSYDLLDGNYIKENDSSFLNNLKNIDFDLEKFKKSSSSLIDRIIFSSKFINLNPAKKARLECSKYLKSIGIDGIIFEQSGSIAYCIFNKEKLANEKIINDYFNY